MCQRPATEKSLEEERAHWHCAAHACNLSSMQLFFPFSFPQICRHLSSMQFQYLYFRSSMQFSFSFVFCNAFLIWMFLTHSPTKQKRRHVVVDMCWSSRDIYVSSMQFRCFFFPPNLCQFVLNASLIYYFSDPQCDIHFVSVFCNAIIIWMFLTLSLTE